MGSLWRLSFILCVMFFVNVTVACSGVIFDLEGGTVFTGYNDVRIPGTTGTLFSLSEEFEADASPFVRGRISYPLGERSTIELLVAPLSIESSGQGEEEIRFEGIAFPANMPLEVTYRFDSYRLTYRYELHGDERLRIGLGGTAKIRDAEISVRGGDFESKKTNTGFVPLINFRLQWELQDRVGLLLEGDALVAPQGRAEDVLAAVTYRAQDGLRLKLGYRILEGGADNDEVYSFALFQYIALGVVIRI